MEFEKYYSLMKDFLIKHLSLISFMSILFGGIFYYIARILEVQNNYIIQLENSNKIYNDLFQNQGVVLQKQQQIIINLETVISEKLSSINDPNALKWYAFGVACTLLVGVAAYYYFKSNNSDSSSPSQPDSQSNSTNAEFQSQMEKLTKDVVDAAKGEFANMSKEMIDVVHNVRTDAIVESKDNISAEIDNVKITELVSAEIDNVKIAELVSAEVNNAVKLEFSQISDTIKVGIKSIETVSNKGCENLHGMCVTSFEQMVKKSSNIESKNVEKVANSFGTMIQSWLAPQMNKSLSSFERGMAEINAKFTSHIANIAETSTNNTVEIVNKNILENDRIVKMSVSQAQLTNKTLEELMQNLTYSKDLDSIRGRNLQATTKIMELRSSIQGSVKNSDLKSELSALCTDILDLFS